MYRGTGSWNSNLELHSIISTLAQGRFCYRRPPETSIRLVNRKKAISMLIWGKGKIRKTGRRIERIRVADWSSSSSMSHLFA